MAITTCVFDAYGTLFDVSAAARVVAGEPGRDAFRARWVEVANHWRLKQLQYSWLRAVALNDIRSDSDSAANKRMRVTSDIDFPYCRNNP